MHFSKSTLTGAVAALTLVSPAIAGYSLEDSYTTENFFSSFSFFDSADPTHGYVQYVDQSTAQQSGLISNNTGTVYMGVDHTNVASGSGRSSVRVTSNKAYNHGLIILDLAHMPQGCGTWPAFWTVGPNWPSNGEIDIIEGVNQQTSNAMTLHTGPNCGIAKEAASFLGTIQTASCDVNAPGQSANAGCSIDAAATNTYGSGLNSNGGGVYAMEWTSDAISVYFFSHSGAIPSDITDGNPDPSQWGQPQAVFSGPCDLDSSVLNQQIVFDTTFCGDWAGAVWSSGSCASAASTCEAFVQNNPSAFQEAYWSINSLKVYQDNGNVQPIVSASSTLAPASTAISSLQGVVPTLPSTVSSLAPIPDAPFEISVIASNTFNQQAATTTPEASLQDNGFGKGITSTAGPQATPTSFLPTPSSTPAAAPTPAAPAPAPTPQPATHNGPPPTANADDTLDSDSGDDGVEVLSIANWKREAVIATTLLKSPRASSVAAAPAALAARNAVPVVWDGQNKASAGSEDALAARNAIPLVWDGQNKASVGSEDALAAVDTKEQKQRRHARHLQRHQNRRLHHI